MAGNSCVCGTPAFPNMGTPQCVIEMKSMFKLIFIPRFQADGVTRNSIDVSSATLGSDITALITTATAVQERLYPSQKVDNPTIPRTDTAFETVADGTKKKLDGEGGVYTITVEFFDQGSVFQLQRELKKAGCIDLDVYIAPIDGSLWGTKPTALGTALFGYKLSKQTIDSFFAFPVPGANGKIMFSVDIDQTECIENSYVITSDDMTSTGGVSSLELAGNISGFQDLPSPTPSNTTIQTTVYEGFGTAGTRGIVEGLVLANFAVNDDTAGAPVVPTLATETPADSGIYILTVPPLTATNVLTVSVITVAGYDVADGTTIAS